MKSILVAIMLLLMAGCANTVFWEPAEPEPIRPIIDTSLNPKDRDLENDVQECNSLANYGVVSPGKNAAKSGVAGALGGAAVGAIIGAAFGVNPGPTAAIGAASGGIGGAARGAVSASLARKQVVSNCMKGRGYSVLN